jgi:GTP pyrophosphokinase
MNVVEMSSPGRKNGSIWAPKVNGKHNKHVQHVSLKVKGELFSEGNGVAKIIQANIPMYKEVLPGLESWQASKIASWHNHEGHSIQWFSVVCMDRRGKFYLVNKNHVSFSLALSVALKH